MKSVIVCVSVSHGNTRKVADAMADELGATVVEPESIGPSALGGYDLVGFGSGIFAMAFHPRLRQFVDDLPTAQGTKAFVLATRGGPDLGYTRRLARTLRGKGFDVVGTFSCLGLDTWLPLRLIGGLNKNRPNRGDLEAARAVARQLREQVAAGSERR
jgi:flavodoxin